MRLDAAESRALFERRRAAWLAEDSAAYLALFADELVMHLPGRAEPIRGRAPYAKLVAASFTGLRVSPADAVRAERERH